MGWPGYRSSDLIRLAIKTARRRVPTKRTDGRRRQNSTTRGFCGTHHLTTHPHDDGVMLGGVDAVSTADYDAVVSLCRMGTRQVAPDHVEFWLVDDGHDSNANLEFVLDDAARTVQALRAEGKRVLLHCVQAHSRTPSVAARYSMLIGRDPYDVRSAMPWARPKRELWNTAVGNAAVGHTAVGYPGGSMPAITVVEGDITTLTGRRHRQMRPTPGSSVVAVSTGAIHRAGGPEILKACEVLRNTSLPDGLPVGAARGHHRGKAARQGRDSHRRPEVFALPRTDPDCFGRRTPAASPWPTRSAREPSPFR